MVKYKYGKVPANVAEEITRNKLCVDLIGTNYIGRKGKKDNLNFKSVTTIDPVMGWSEITEYNNKHVITTTDLVETT